jgi:ABC-type dipeptide/oligopeptide/nickel transport system permease component
LQKFILRRGWQAMLVVVGVSLVVFFAMRLSGDPSLLMLPPEATEADRVRFQHEQGLDRPIYVQYAVFLRRAVQGDFGKSLRYRQPAFPLVLERLPATLELSLAAMLVSLAVAIPAGVLAGVRRNSAYDALSMLGALFGQSMPVFWLGIMLILIFSVRLGLFPTSGRDGLQHLVLPAVTLGLYSTARVTRLVRAGMLDVLGQEYIRTAWAKGLTPRRVIFKHALMNTLIPVVTIVGLELGTLLGGAVITETIFAWPGVGRLVVTAIFQRDYPVVQAAVMVLALSFVFSNFVVDLVYGYLDPRIRYQ